MIRTKIAAVAVSALLVGVGFGCKEVNRQNAPVQLVVTTNQTLQRVDISPNPPDPTACNQAIGTVIIRSVLIQNAAGGLANNTTLNDVKITQYRVSYVRTDGGTLVPAPFTRSISIKVSPGGQGESTNFQAFQPDAITLAPFAALLPNNGGRDPETGRPLVKMDLILDVFGETLAGERVSGQTRVPLDFCYGCGCA